MCLLVRVLPLILVASMSGLCSTHQGAPRSTQESVLWHLQGIAACDGSTHRSLHPSTPPRGQSSPQTPSLFSMQLNIYISFYQYNAEDNGEVKFWVGMILTCLLLWHLGSFVWCVMSVLRVCVYVGCAMPGTHPARTRAVCLVQRLHAASLQRPALICHPLQAKGTYHNRDILHVTPGTAETIRISMFATSVAAICLWWPVTYFRDAILCN